MPALTVKAKILLDRLFPRRVVSAIAKYGHYLLFTSPLLFVATATNAPEWTRAVFMLLAVGGLCFAIVPHGNQARWEHIALAIIRCMVWLPYCAYLLVTAKSASDSEASIAIVIARLLVAATAIFSISWALLGTTIWRFLGSAGRPAVPGQPVPASNREGAIWTAPFRAPGRDDPSGMPPFRSQSDDPFDPPGELKGSPVPRPRIPPSLGAAVALHPPLPEPD